MKGTLPVNCCLLKSLRQELCLSQEDFTLECQKRSLCLSLATVKRAEKGCCVSYRTIRLLAKFHNIELNQLISTAS